MKILFISTALPPFFESQTIRNAYFIRGLQEAGHEIIGVTKNEGTVDKSLCEILLSKIETIEVTSGWYFHLKQIVDRLGLKFIGKCLDVIGPLVLIPDLNIGWGAKLIKNVEVMAHAKVCDLIISSSGSYEAHLAGRDLSKKYLVPLVAELGDPWSLNPIWPESSIFKKLFNKKLEATVFSQADLVTFTTKETCQVYAKLYPTVRFEYIPMGYSDSEFSFSVSESRNRQFIDLVYVGVAYRGSRDITPFLDSIRRVDSNRLKARFYGKSSASFREYVSQMGYDFATFHGQVPYSESVNIIQHADVLVIIGNDSELQIPGKTYMYLASGKPILYLGNNSLGSDPTWNLIKNFAGVYGFNGTLSGVPEVLAELSDKYDDFLALSYSRFEDRVLQQFCWSEIGNNFRIAVEQVGDNEA